MRNVLTVAMLLLLPAMAQARKYEALALAKEERKLNSASRPGGVTRAVIKVDVPWQCDYLYISVEATLKGPLEDLGLHTKISKHIKEEGVNISVGSSLLNKLTAPTGDGITEILIMEDGESAAAFDAKQTNFTYLAEYSRKNFCSGVIGIPLKNNLMNKTIYICLRNPSVLNAQYVSIEAVATKPLK